MKLNFYKTSIKNKLLVDIFLLLSLVLIMVYSFFTFISYKGEKKDNILFTKEVVKVLSQDFAKIILLNDLSTAADITTKLKSFSQIEAVFVYNKNKKIIFSYKKNSKKFNNIKIELTNKFEFEKGFLKADLPIVYLNNKIGYVKIYLKMETLGEILKRDIGVLFLSFLVILIFSFLLTSYYAKEFTKPILEIVEFLSKLDFEHIPKKRLKLNLKNEFKILIDEINLMLDKFNYFLKQEKISSIAFEVSEGMMIVDKNFKVIKVNEKYSKITGYLEEEVVGKTAPFLRYKLNDEILYEEMIESLKSLYEWRGEIKSKKKDREIYYLKMDIKAVIEDEINYYVVSFKDITSMKHLENKMKYLREYDALTGLVKKEGFLKTLEKARGNSVIIYIKMKDLSVINAVYGYEIGNFWIKRVATILKKTEASCVARIGNSYFALFFNDLGDNKLEKLKKILEIINIKLSSINLEKINIKIFMGVYLFSKEEPQKALNKAYIALENAIKENKKIVYYNKNIELELKDSFNLYKELKDALYKKELLLYYQPQYDINGNIIGAEALIRWNHPKRGLLTPFYFIEIVENSDLVYSVGDFVIEEGIKTIKQLDIMISVNVHPRQFRNKYFVENLIKKVKEYNIKPSFLKIELLESSFVDDVEHTKKTMQKLKKYGFKISIDDFGTGYSSLKYIVNFPIDQIKIDQTFVMNMFKEPKNISIIKSIVTLADELNLNLIAEGVESMEHFEKLKEIEVRYFQGYYFSKPVPFKEFVLKLS